MGDHEEWSWSWLITFPVCGLVAALCLSFAWHHREVYFVRKNWEVWRIPEAFRETVRASASYPNSTGGPTWNGPAPVTRSRW